MAKDTIGSMTAVVRATAGQFAADINDIKSSVKGLKDTVDSSSTSGGIFASLKQGMAIGAGLELFRGIVDSAKAAIGALMESVNDLDELGDFAQQMNMSASSLDSMHSAAILLGSSAEVVDVAIEKMVQKIG